MRVSTEYVHGEMREGNKTKNYVKLMSFKTCESFHVEILDFPVTSATLVYSRHTIKPTP